MLRQRNLKTSTRRFQVWTHLYLDHMTAKASVDSFLAFWWPSNGILVAMNRIASFPFSLLLKINFQYNVPLCFYGLFHNVLFKWALSCTSGLWKECARPRVCQIVRIQHRTCGSLSGNLESKPFTFQHHTANSPFLLLHITYSRRGENFLIYQQISCWVIKSFILMTSLTKNAFMLQREIWSPITFGA